MMENTVKQLKEYLEKHNIKPSTIRLKVLEYLLGNRVHPTADDIYRNVLPYIPTLSKTSIYNTLELFADKGVVKVLALDNNEACYDIDTRLHGHFKCRVCSRVYDFTIPHNVSMPHELKDFEVNAIDINFYGVCHKCKNKYKKQEGGIENG